MAAAAATASPTEHTPNPCGVCRHRPAISSVDFSCGYDLREVWWAGEFKIRAWYYDGGADALEVWNVPLCSTCKKAMVEAVLFWLHQNQRQNTTTGGGGSNPCACCCTTASAADTHHLRFRYHDVHEDFADGSFLKTDTMQRRARFVDKKVVCTGKYAEYELDPKARATTGKVASLAVCSDHRCTFVNWFGSWIDLVRLARARAE